MRQMVFNTASVTGLTGKTFHPFVCPPLDARRDHIITIPFCADAISGKADVSVDPTSFDGLFSGELVDWPHHFVNRDCSRSSG